MNAVLFRMMGGFSVALGVVLSALLAAPDSARADAEMEVEGDLEVAGQVKVGTDTVSAGHIAHFKGRVLAENEATAELDERNHGVSVWKDLAYGIEAHYSNSSWQTAVFGRKYSGVSYDNTALTFGAYDGDETEQQNFYHYMTIRNNGEVGIGTETPVEMLDVQGVLAMKTQGTTDPDSSIGYAKLYAKGLFNVEMYAMDKDENVTQLTSHKDPRDFAPDLQGTSFGDPEVALPFSFHHTNAYIGKGAVVDLAAVVRDLEAMTGKSYTTHYDLPSASPERLLARYPWIEIPIEEAWEEYEAMVPERTTAYDYNLDEQTVYLVEVPTGGDSEVGTGILKRRLKENVRFEPETGKFLRRPTATEIPQGATPDLPAWIADRLPPE